MPKIKLWQRSERYLIVSICNKIFGGISLKNCPFSEKGLDMLVTSSALNMDIPNKYNLWTFHSWKPRWKTLNSNGTTGFQSWRVFYETPGIPDFTVTPRFWTTEWGRKWELGAEQFVCLSAYHTGYVCTWSVYVSCMKTDLPNWSNAPKIGRRVGMKIFKYKGWAWAKGGIS